MDFETVNYQGVYNSGEVYNANDVVLVTGIGYFLNPFAFTENVDPQANPEIWTYFHDEFPAEPVNDPIEAYDELVSYPWGYAVTSGGNTYISLVYNNLGNLLSNPAFWRLLPEFATLPACGSEYVGTWKFLKEYLVDQVVTHNGNNYTAVIQNRGQEPGVVKNNIWKQCSGSVALPTATDTILYDPDVALTAGNEVVTLDGFRAVVIRDTKGAAVDDTRYFQPAANTIALDLDTIALTFTGAATKGRVYDYKGLRYLATGNTASQPLVGNNNWKLIGAAAFDTDYVNNAATTLSGLSYTYNTSDLNATMQAFNTDLPPEDEVSISGRSIVTSPQGMFMGERSLVSNFYMRFRDFVYHWKNKDQWRLHNKGVAQTADGEKVNFDLTFYISYKGLRKIIDFIHILTDAVTRFKVLEFTSNFVSVKRINDFDVDRYKIKEGEHRVAAKQKDVNARVRGNWVKVSIQRSSSQDSLSFSITTVKSKSRLSH